MKILLPLVIAAFVVAGFAYYTLFTGPTIPEARNESMATTPTPDRESADPTERQAFSGTGSMYRLLERGDSLECAIEYTAIDASVTGTMFTDDGDLRGDFVVPSPDLVSQSVRSIIIEEGTIYEWVDLDGDVSGSRQPAQFDAATLERLVSPVGLSREVSYDCLTWPQVDRTVFTPPTNVLFTDQSAAVVETGLIFDGEEEF
jgi:hypothetical protein